MEDYKLNECAREMIVKEYINAVFKNEKFNSAHEGFAVLKEEVDELWDEVKKNGQERSQEAMLEEAIQVGAMAMRFIVDVCLRNK